MWYDKYKNAPYRHLGLDLETGIDCGNMLKLVYKEQLNIDVPYDTRTFCYDIDQNWYNNIDIGNPMLELFDNPDLGFENIGNKDIQVYDIVLIHLGSSPIINHCALYVDTNKLLQVRLGHNSYISSYGNYYKQYTAGIYRYKGLKNE